MKKLKFILLGTFSLIMAGLLNNAFAQENVVEDDYISNVFSHSILINAQTTETIEKSAFEFRIQHRFGEMDFNESKETILKEFLGFDGSANIRFSLAYALNNNLQIGIGRTKIDKVVDLDAKYRLLRQKESGTPISLTAYFDAAISSSDFPEVGSNEFFTDYETPFEYKFFHRFTYNTQLLVSRKFGEKLSIQFTPTFIYKNLVPAGYDNFIAATTFGGRFKTGLKSYVIFEVATKFNNRMDNYKDPISIGYEIGTAGHAFQFFISTTNQIMEQNLYFNEPLDYTDGKFLLGFNIKRTFWH